MAFTYIVPYAEEAGNVSNTANITINNANVTNNANVGNTLTTSNLTASGNVSFTGANVSLGNVSNLHITGGTANYFLQTNGAGNLVWAAATGGESSISNGNSSVSIPVANGNINMSVAGNSNVIVITGTGANINGYANVTGNINTAGLISATGNVTGNYINGNGYNLTNIQASAIIGTINATTAGTVVSNAQPNITSVGILSNLSVSGDANVGNLSVTGNANLGNALYANYFIGSGNNLSNIQAANITGTVANANFANTSGNANLANYVIQSTQSNITALGTLTGLTVNGTANLNGTTNFTNNANFTGSNTYISNVANLRIPGGTNGYFLQTDGAGNLNWVNGTTTGNGVVGGSNTQVQYNNAGNFGGSAGLTFNSTSNTLTAVNLVVTGNLTATITTPTTSSNIFITKGQFVNLNPNSSFNNLNVLDGTVIFNSNAVNGSTTANSNVQVGMSFNIRGNATTTLNSLMLPGDKITLIYHQTVTQPAISSPPLPFFTVRQTTAYIKAANVIQIDGSNVNLLAGSDTNFLTDAANGGGYSSGFLSFMSVAPAGIIANTAGGTAGGIVANVITTTGSGSSPAASVTARFAISIYKLSNTPTWGGYFTSVSF
jgi:hypothetical protein